MNALKWPENNAFYESAFTNNGLYDETNVTD